MSTAAPPVSGQMPGGQAIDRLGDGYRRLSGRGGAIEAGRGTLGDELFAVILFMALPIEMQVFADIRLPLLGLSFLGVLIFRRDLIALLGRGWIAFLVPGFCLLSVLWSNFPFETVRFSLYAASALVVAALIATRLSHRQIVVAILISQVILAVASLAFPTREFHYGPAGGWANVGVFAQKNNLGTHMVTMLVAALCILFDPRYRRLARLLAVGAVGIGPILILGALSATSIVLSLVGVALASMIGAVWRPAAAVRGLRLLLVSGGLVLMSGGLLVYASTRDADPYQAALEALNKDSTLTGRTLIWERASDVVQARPVLGVGADGFWRPGVGAARQIKSLVVADDESAAFAFHNAYFEVVVHIGHIGLVIFLLVMGWALRRLILHWWRRQRGVDGFFVIVALLILCRALTESELFVNMSMSMIVLWSGVFLALRKDDPDGPAIRRG